MKAHAALELGLALAAVALVVLEARRARASVVWNRWLGRAWAVLAIASVAAYVRTPNWVTKRVDEYDLVHYYLNAKYFDELGYTRLYQACLVADMEGKNRLARVAMMRDLYDQRVERSWFVQRVREHPEVVKSHFSAARWRAFRHDVGVLDRGLRTSQWKRILIDRGYNATPTWHAVGHAVASAIPVRHAKALCHIDTVLVALMFLAIGWAAGRRNAAIAVVWFCVSFSASWPGVGQAMLRYDWLATTVAGACLIGRGRRFLGGALVGWAALSRIFPAILLLFPAIRAAHALFVHRRLDRDALAMAAGFLLVTGAGTAATWATLGSDHFVAFRHDLAIQLAPENLSVNRMGVDVALAYRGETRESQLPLAPRRARYLATGRMGPFRTAIGLVLLGLLAMSVLVPAGAKRPARTDADLVELGFFGFALLMTASFYYWTMRLLAVLLHARHEGASRWDVRGLAAVFAIEAWSWGWDLVVHYRYGLTATTSILVALYAAAVCVVRARAALRRRRAIEGRDGRALRQNRSRR